MTKEDKDIGTSLFNTETDLIVKDLILANHEIMSKQARQVELIEITNKLQHYTKRYSLYYTKDASVDAGVALMILLVLAGISISLFIIPLSNIYYIALFVALSIALFLFVFERHTINKDFTKDVYIINKTLQRWADE